MKARQLLERIAGHTSFSQPENFDKVDEGSGWVLYTGGNDWEMAPTAMAVIFPGNEKSERVWATIKLPEGLSSSDADDVSHDSVEAQELNNHAKKARTTWVRVARRIHGQEGESGFKPDWKKSFEQALADKELEPFVDESGNDKTQWVNSNI